MLFTVATMIVKGCVCMQYRIEQVCMYEAVEIEMIFIVCVLSVYCPLNIISIKMMEFSLEE